jgi:deoxycytidylate deaminase
MIRIASRQAEKSTHRYKLGAVIVKGGRVLSTGYNEIRYSKELQKGSIHAEEAAILKLLKAKRLSDLAGADLYVSRISHGGYSRLSCPCAGCMALIRAVLIKKVIYTTDDGGTATLSL